MIAKHVPMQSVVKSNFANLVLYLCDTQRKQERLGWIAVTNCVGTTPNDAVREVLATQAQNTRAKSDKTYHLIVSFRPGEQVNEATCRAIEARLCDGLGLGAHQRVSALHHDTDSLHLHIAVNKIHPRRYTIHNPYYDHPKLGQLCAELEREHNLAPDNHCAHQRGGACRAADMERHGGLQSLLGWIRRECQDQLLAAQSWADLRRVLHKHGLTLRERGTGFVVMAANGTAVKASSIDPSCSRPKLEARFGVYEPLETSRAVEVPAKTYAKTPLPCRVDTTALYARYQDTQQQAGARGAADRAAAHAAKERQRQAAKQRARLKRVGIKLLTSPGMVRRMLYHGASTTLREQLAQIQENYRQQRQAINGKCQRCTWVDWLRAEAIAGNEEALAALRARSSMQRMPGNTMVGTKRATGAPISMPCDSITKNGTVIYRFGSTAVRDDGDQLTVSRGATEEGLQAALRMALLRYGPLLRVGGTNAFKQDIVQAAVVAGIAVEFDDVVLESRRQTMLRQASVQTDSCRQAMHGQCSPPAAPGGLACDGTAVTRAAGGVRRGNGRQRSGP